jgi:hypothetical protein
MGVDIPSCQPNKSECLSRVLKGGCRPVGEFPIPEHKPNQHQKYPMNVSAMVPEPVKKAFGAGGAAKAHQLEAHMVEPTKDTRITSDFGTKQTNTDDWLRVNSEDQLGPSLLEDHFGREKVRWQIPY